MGDIIDDVKARLVERIESPADLLAFKLGSALKMEHRLLWTFDALASEAESIDVEDVLHRHVEETQFHIASVKRALKALGAEADQEHPSPALEGIDKDADSNAKHASEELSAMVVLSGAAEIEHHEIAVYETLVRLAEARGEREVVEALRAILEQEQRQLSKVSDTFKASAEDLDLDAAAKDDLLHRLKSKLPHKISSPRELLEFNLGAALNMEDTILGMLRRLEEQAQAGRLKHQLHDHAEETEEHVQNIERAFAAIGAQPQKKPCRAIDAIEKESKTNLKITRDGMVDAVILAGAAETEYYEIAVYDGLICLAESLGADDALPPLRENLAQEQHMLEQVSDAILREASAGQVR